MNIGIEKIRSEFPILDNKIHGHPLVYLDNAATTQKPKRVIQAIDHFYCAQNSNIHRGAHTLSEQATILYENVRKKCQQFIHAKQVEEIVFCRGTTEAINLVASSYGRTFLKAGDEILITALEHHSNIVPWQLLVEQTGAVLKVAPIDNTGTVILESFAALLNPKTKIVAINHVSNSLGTINPVKEMIAMVRQTEAVVLVDGAQALPHMKVDVQDLDCDFYATSAHKMFGPTGIGFLYGKAHLLEKMPPYQGGGDMIHQVSFEKSTYAPIPYKFEAGTPNIADTIGLGAAIDYLNTLDRVALREYENELLKYATQRAEKFPGLRLIGTAKNKASILSFVLEGVHPHDIGTILDSQGIAVRTGHHCTMPVMKFFKVPATVRASFAFYNTKEEVDALFAGLTQVKELFHVG